MSGSIDFGPVERDEVALAADERLQAVHVVGDGRRARSVVGVVGQVEVPARPGASPARHEARVGVEDGLVGLVGERGQQLTFLRRRLARPCPSAWSAWQASTTSSKRSAPPAWKRVTPSPPGSRTTRSIGVVEADPVGVRRRQRLDVASRAAGDRSPGRAVADLQDAVVLEEVGEERRREGPHLLGVGGPDRRDLGDDQAVDEVVGVVPVLEEVAERRPAPVDGEQAACLAVEADEVREHPDELRVDQVAGPGEDPAGAAGRPLEAAPAVGHAEAHVGGLTRDAELAEHALEVRVVAVVEDDEAGVDVDGPARLVDGDRVRVAAGVVAGLEDRDPVTGRMELRGREQAGDPAADDGDAAGLAHQVADFFAPSAAGAEEGTAGGVSARRLRRPSRALSPRRLNASRIGSSANLATPFIERSAS